ncbi:hypothetical protein MNBD_GAMMA02-1083 [hydrothermal vent metagenome]|uniref:Uncharacterized protein n=1 Tax=hydrothermal vent metagenome TaxID=652676 RepID=A0A3B0W608_9ZZZZ
MLLIMKKKITLCLGLLLSFGLSAQTPDPEKAFAERVSQINSISQLLEVVGDAADKEQFARQELVLKRLLELRPYSPEFKLALVKAYAAQDKKSAAYNDLVQMQKAGLSYPIGDQKGYDNIKGTKVFDYIEDGMNSNNTPFGEGEKAFEIPHRSGMLFENMAYDETGKRFLLGSIRAGSVYQYTEGEGFKEFIKPSDPAVGPWGIIDLVVDDEADLLWTSSATMPHFSGTNQANFGQAMISKFRLSSGELVNNFAMAKTNQPMLFSALHLTAGQNLYFTNVFNSDFFKISKDSDQVQPVLSLSGLKNIKAITSNEKESMLYVSDFDQGLFVINLESMQTAPLVKTPRGFFAGINDLFYDDGDLVAIQSGVQPARLMRYVLKQDLFLHNMFPIEASNPNFKALGNGTLVGDHVYYAANSQWEKMDPLGRLLPEQSWEPLVIMKSPTKYRMEEHMEQQRKMEEIKKKRGLK